MTPEPNVAALPFLSLASKPWLPQLGEIVEVQIEGGWYRVCYQGFNFGHIQVIALVPGLCTSMIVTGIRAVELS